MSGTIWGRLYFEWAHDLKIQTLPEAFQRRHAMLLCMHIEGLVCPTDEEAAFYMRLTLEQWLETKAAFLNKGMMDESNHLINWERRQYKSDNSAARTRKYREAASDRHSDVTVTPPDTESETETEAETEEKIPPLAPPGETAPENLRPAEAPPAQLGPAEAAVEKPPPAEAPPVRLGPAEAAPKNLRPAEAPPARLGPEEAAVEKPPPAATAPARLGPEGAAVENLRPAERVRAGPGLRDPVYARVADAYHRLLPHLPPHQVWSDRDVRHFRLNRDLDPARGRLEFWSEAIFPQVARSPFLSGRCPPRRGAPWRASLPWLLNPDNVAKILNGHYPADEPVSRHGHYPADEPVSRRDHYTAGRSGGQNPRLPAPQEFAHEIRPLGSKVHAEKN